MNAESCEIILTAFLLLLEGGVKSVVLKERTTQKIYENYRFKAIYLTSSQLVTNRIL